eukprot:jgi/Phyca11/103595/e_gw1.8.342.1
MGLTRHPAFWLLTLCAFLTEPHFTKLVKDQCVFGEAVKGHTCYIFVYVDDLRPHQ